jgi:hypothetical protein
MFVRELGVKPFVSFGDIYTTLQFYQGTIVAQGHF